MTSTIPLLVLCPLRPQTLAQIAATYDVIHAPDAALRAQAIAAHGARVRTVLTIGPSGSRAPRSPPCPRRSWSARLVRATSSTLAEHLDLGAILFRY